MCIIAAFGSTLGLKNAVLGQSKFICIWFRELSCIPRAPKVRKSKKESGKCASILRFAWLGTGVPLLVSSHGGGVSLSSPVGSEPSPLAISTQGVMVVCGAGLAKELD